MTIQLKNISELYDNAVDLLKQLIEIPSLSKEESSTAEVIEEFFTAEQITSHRSGNNVWAFANEYDKSKPTIWLNSHHDTVKPNAGYTKDPFQAIIEVGKLYGLGSNDAGGPLVSLMAAFSYFCGKELPVNLIMIASAEEEISGQNGIASVIGQLPPCELAIVGEPTLMDAAVAEKGLMVIDAQIHGKAGHAAREEGINAIYLALEDLQTVQNFKFTRVSPFLGDTKVTATVIHSGQQHNVVPDLCEYVLDVRVTEVYTLDEALEELKNKLKATLTPRSMRLQSSRVPEGHLILDAIQHLKLNTYGSPTLSDQALIPYPSVKVGPGDSARSHSADEYIYLEEIRDGIAGYIKLLETYFRMITESNS